MNTEQNTVTEQTEQAPVSPLFHEDHRATYCPEDNKLRLYVGRVPRDQYLNLRADGWVALPKQREAGKGDFAATWTPSRRDTALDYAGIIEDEDAGPAERAADRAERFSGYRDKRSTEATGHADRYDAQPAAHGFQDVKKSERAVARHEKIADRAGDAWSKAEYWQRRTAGVISHALYKSTPGVRMGRIKTLEAELRKCRAGLDQYAALWADMQKIAAMTPPEKQTAQALHYVGTRNVWSEYLHPRAATIGEKIMASGTDNAAHRAAYYAENKLSLYSLLSNEFDPITGAEACALFFSDHSEPRQESDWTQHLTLRLAYENQMIEAEGGRAADVEMIPGGFIGSRQIRKVNKSNTTGRVVSVEVMGTRSGFTRESGYKEHATRAVPVLLNIERAGADAYRAPTPEELTAFKAAMKAEKDAKPKTIKPPLVNPTDADAERLQAIWNESAKAEYAAGIRDQYKSEKIVAESLAKWKPSTVCRITQAVYSANSKGGYARAETKEVCGNGTQVPPDRFYDYAGQAKAARERGPVVCQVRTTSADSESWHAADRVIILTDKPQKPLPAAVWEKYVAPVEAEQTETETRKSYAGKSGGLSYTVNA